MAASFEGKVVVITGANSGLGEAALRLFIEQGATVYGTNRKKETLDAAKARHPKARWLLADVNDPAQVHAAFERVEKEAGRIDVLVNNAAIFTFAPLAQSGEEMVRAQFETNVAGVVRVAREALPGLKKARGHIINISSAAGHKAAPGGAIYGATKAAVESLTRSWALELAPEGVRVNAIAPGPTETPGFDKLGLPPEQTKAVKASFTSQVPLGRMGEPQEVAKWIVALVSPDVTWVTGQVLSIDGGMSLA